MLHCTDVSMKKMFLRPFDQSINQGYLERWLRTLYSSWANVIDEWLSGQSFAFIKLLFNGQSFVLSTGNKLKFIVGTPAG